MAQIEDDKKLLRASIGKTRERRKSTRGFFNKLESSSQKAMGINQLKPEAGGSVMDMRVWNLHDNIGEIRMV